MKILQIIKLSFILLILGCSKKSTPGNSDIIPANLTVSAIVNSDNSGNVSFTASATNSVLYTFDLGNSITQVSTSGLLTYKYSTSGAYTVTVVAKSSTGQTISKSILVNVTVVLSLVWSDEFDIPGAPNSSNWDYDIGTGSNGWGNNEAEYYTNRPENIIVENGLLKIIPRKENYSGAQYTSARILSKGKKSFKYGRVEIRAKLPSGGGTWPALWLLGDDVSTAGWPACGEIDMMEHAGNNLNKITCALHYPGHSGGNPDGGFTITTNATTEFHNYSIEWNASTIKFFVDTQLYYTFSNNSSVPFNKNFFLIINCAMGGNYGGSIDPGFVSSTFEIDYVRVFQ